MTDSSPARWLLLIHQIPPDPAYLRVKVGRRLARMGAVALKNSVYVLPRSDAAIEDFQWVRREIVAGRGEATLIDAQLVDGLSDTEVEALFKAARDAEYEAVAEQARLLAKQARGKLNLEKRQLLETEVARLERRIADVSAIDFFGASGREIAAAAVRALHERLLPSERRSPAAATLDRSAYRGRTWVTRTGIYVDRIACAWLIARFIDPEAKFKFVAAKGYVPEPGELRFDMFEAEFGHEQELCSFEVLCLRMGLEQPGLRAIAEIVHEIDLKDAKFGRPETDGVAAQLIGITLLHREDLARIEHGSRLFEQLLSFYARRRLDAALDTPPRQKAR